MLLYRLARPGESADAGETRYLKCLSRAHFGHFFVDLVLINALVLTDFQRVTFHLEERSAFRPLVNGCPMSEERRLHSNLPKT